MSEHTIEKHLTQSLAGDAQILALDFVSYLRAQGMQFEKGTDYWEVKRYWMVKYNASYRSFNLR